MASTLDLFQQEYTEAGNAWDQVTQDRLNKINELDRLRREAESANFIDPSSAGLWGAIAGVNTPRGALGSWMDAYQRTLTLRDAAKQGAIPEYLELYKDQGTQMSNLRDKLVSGMATMEAAGLRGAGAGSAGMPFKTVVLGQGKALMTNAATGEAITLAVDDVNQFNNMYSMNYKVLIDGGMTNVELARNSAFHMTVEDMERAKSVGRKIPELSTGGFPGRNQTQAAPGTVPPAAVTPGAVPPVAAANPKVSRLQEYLAAIVAGDRDAAMDLRKNSGTIPGLENWSKMTPFEAEKYAKREINVPEVTDKPSAIVTTPATATVPSMDYAKAPTTPSIPPKLALRPPVGGGGGAGVSSSGSPILLSPEQRALMESRGKQEAEMDVKAYEEARKQGEALFSANQSISALEGSLMSGKTTSGALHEQLNKIGGYMNYIDPTNSLAQAAGNDAAYFGNLMNLVRDKIKSLGSGTAVSNLDLIVTQKSVGDLRNTPQGNLKLLGLMKLANAIAADINDERVDYYEQHKTLKGFRAGDVPRYAIRATRHAQGKGNVFTYEPQSREDWEAEQRERNPGKNIPQPVLDREWKKFSLQSVQNVFKF